MIEHALSILAPGMDAPGLFTGTLTLSRAGKVGVEFIASTPSEGEAFARCWRCPDEASANQVADYLIGFMPPGTSIRRVEIRRAEG